MSKDIIDFDQAKGPHVFRRKEGKVKAIKKAFAAARAGDKPTKPGGDKGGGKGRNKRKKK